MAQLDWTTDELILAFDLVRRHGERGVRSHHPDAIELSRVLRSLPVHPVHRREANFRSPESVQRKTFDIETGHPKYRGKRTKGSRLENLVRSWFDVDAAAMAATADALRLLADNAHPLTVVDDAGDWAADEGGILLRMHRLRERDGKLRDRKLQAILSAEGRLVCEVCRFDFEVFYGDRGRGFMEVHHVAPLHVTGPTRTSLRDLAALCANCHRMLHRRPLLTPGELAAAWKAGRPPMATRDGSSVEGGAEVKDTRPVDRADDTGPRRAGWWSTEG